VETESISETLYFQKLKYGQFLKELSNKKKILKIPFLVILFHQLCSFGILKDFGAFVFRVKQFYRRELLDPEDGDNTILRNIGNYTANDTVSHPRIIFLF